MFLLQYALEVKLGEKTRLETIIKVGEKSLKNLDIFSAGGGVSAAQRRSRAQTCGTGF